MRDFRAAVVQTAIPREDPIGNLEHALALADATPGADLYLFPELFTCGYALDRAEEIAARAPETLARLSAWARERDSLASGSILHPAPGGGTINAAFCVERDGTLLPLYAKVHLFGPLGEPEFLKAGSERVVWETSLGRFGAAICYDLRFPEMIRRLAVEGAEALLLPAEWPEPRTAHWRLLTEARAVENGMYVLAANRVGRQGRHGFAGQSRIVTPWGELAASLGAEEGCAAAAVEGARVAEARRLLPVLANRVPEVDD
jgi:predicted amidohydrolase